MRVSLVGFLTSTLLPLTAMATEYGATGTVQKVFALDSIQYGADKSHILIAGFASAGTCATNDGLVALVIRDGDESGRRQIAAALAAKTAGLSVVVRTDDNYKNSAGQCYLKYLEID